MLSKYVCFSEFSFVKSSLAAAKPLPMCSFNDFMNTKMYACCESAKKKKLLISIAQGVSMRFIGPEQHFYTLSDKFYSVC